MKKASLYAVVPAAGIGTRMGADRPKQYLMLQGKTILEHTLEQLLQFSPIEKIVLPVSINDTFLSKLSIGNHEKIIQCDGGEERYHSVLNGLNTLLNIGAQRQDWVMVHDVARPCIRQQDLENLYQNVDEQGVILGVQVRDTMKRTDDNEQVLSTVARVNLWHALTPQLAPLGVLLDAIEKAVNDGVQVTDEASALEHSGYSPKMLAGHPSNIKVTHPDDLQLADAFLSMNAQVCASPASETPTRNT
ncbi:2-C-methyl-D-erythritol 4-phosphate cytidylyltransferase [Bermanella sp. 47_1433_sub80_T6]|nr:2-C-methyl-D-erythritol 4-phosphate cytidylyltransferase [Bermanella sp. 47_1433_sub80_T6]